MTIAAVTLAILLPSSIVVAHAPAQSEAIPTPCAVNELSLTFDSEQGNYNGMSHSGDRLVLRNIGARVCTVPQKPQLTFLDKAGKQVNLHMQIPPGMHPGPVMLPVAIPPEAEATGRMRWVSGDAYGAGNCISTKSAILTVGMETLEADFPATVCSAAGATAHYEQESLHRDAPYTPRGAVR